MIDRRTVAGLALSAAALVGIALHEGYRDRAYDDGVGVSTIGFGTTAGVKPGDRTTVERALIRLNETAEQMQQEMRNCLGDVPLYPREWDAYVSLAYNIGTGAWCRSTLVKRLKQQPPDYAGACAEISRWVMAGGKVLAGLVKRRAAERATCEGGGSG